MIVTYNPKFELGITGYYDYYGVTTHLTFIAFSSVPQFLVCYEGYISYLGSYNIETL